MGACHHHKSPGGGREGSCFLGPSNSSSLAGLEIFWWVSQVWLAQTCNPSTSPTRIIILAWPHRGPQSLGPLLLLTLLLLKIPSRHQGTGPRQCWGSRCGVAPALKADLRPCSLLLSFLEGKAPSLSLILMGCKAPIIQSQVTSTVSSSASLPASFTLIKHPLGTYRVKPCAGH